MQSEKDLDIMQPEKDMELAQLEKDLDSSEQQLATSEGSATQHEAPIMLTKTRFVLVLVGLVLAIFLVRIANLVPRSKAWD